MKSFILCKILYIEHSVRSSPSVSKTPKPFPHTVLYLGVGGAEHSRRTRLWQCKSHWFLKGSTPRARARKKCAHTALALGFKEVLCPWKWILHTNEPMNTINMSALFSPINIQGIKTLR